jgi:hypothetical protein
LAPDKEKGSLYEFGLEDLKLRSSYGNQNGNKGLDAQAIKNISIGFTGLQGKGMITIDSIKLKKAESFFVRYFWYFMCMSILFFLAYTVYATPFVAFGYEMTPDYHERTRLHAFANTVGQLAWLGVPWFYAIMASGHCGRSHRRLTWHRPGDLLPRKTDLGACRESRQKFLAKHERIFQGHWDHLQVQPVCQTVRGNLPRLQRLPARHVLFDLCHDLLRVFRQ